MHDLVFELKHFVERHKEGSFATQANRKTMLKLFGEQLWQAGYRDMHVEDLKGRHVHRLLAIWQEQGTAPGTLKNRMAALRWWARHIGKGSLVTGANDAYGIPKRETVARRSKAQPLPGDKLAQVRNQHVRMSLELQRAFGLRREESIKIRPWEADRGDTLVLRGSWTKGGRPREIPIRTAAQREVLDRAKALVKIHQGSLIPGYKTYAQQLHSYEWQCYRVGLNKMHGLRHAYAQARFEEFAGFPCPAAGGPKKTELTAEQREADYDARVLLSAELGHCRIEICAAYLGR